MGHTTSSRRRRFRIARAPVLALAAGAGLAAAGCGGDRTGTEEQPRAVVRAVGSVPQLVVLRPGDGMDVPIARVRVPAGLQVRTGSYLPQSRTVVGVDADDAAPGVRVRPCFAESRRTDPAARPTASKKCRLSVTGPSDWTLVARAQAARGAKAGVSRISAVRLVSGGVRTARAAEVQGGATIFYASDDTGYELRGVAVDVAVAPRVPVTIPGAPWPPPPGRPRTDVTDLGD
ncbi:hypothetical protein AB0L40_10915 [Patulibacter sp. NPDC049589]|uniref:hypothetical protein n=1 Tax=Patulibacter sp. NPDC049589 TaxID=3154731 RepID=UPI00344636E7